MYSLIVSILLFMSGISSGKTPKDLVWKNRILIVNQSEEDFYKNDKIKKELEDRKLLVFWFDRGELVYTNYEEEINASLFLERIPVGSTWVLIGLDGGSKSHGKDRPKLLEVFKIIDAMPMRIRERNGSLW